MTERHLAIVPALNEVGAIGATVQEILSFAPGFDVVVIDDGSTDGTGAAAQTAGAHVLRLPFNLGIGGAMQTGYLYALEQGYDVAVQIDGDGQHDPREIPRLLERLKAEPRVNMVTGSRFLESGEGFRSTAARRAGIGIFARVVSMICRQRVTDPTSGLRMADRRAIELFARDYPRDYPEVEAIVLMSAHKLRTCEIPVVMRARTSGTSAIRSFGTVYYMVKVLLAVFVALFRSHPVAGEADAIARETPARDSP